MKENVVIGRVSSIYPQKNTVKVIREDLGTVSAELVVLKRGDTDIYFPRVGEHVLCLFFSVGSSGFVLGGV